MVELSLRSGVGYYTDVIVDAGEIVRFRMASLLGCWIGWLALAGCAGPKPSATLAQGRVLTLKSQLASNELDGAMATCAQATRYASQTARMFALHLHRDQSTLDHLRSAILAQAKSPRSPEAAVAAAGCINGADSFDLIDDAIAADARQRLANASLAGNESGRLAFLSVHELTMIPALLDAEPQGIIVRRSIEYLKAGSGAYSTSSVLISLMQMIREPSSPPEWRDELERALPLIDLTVEQLRDSIAPVFPEYAEQAIRSRTTPVALEVSPADPLLVQDLRARLSRHPELIFVEGREQAKLLIRVSKLRFEEVDDPERTRTITYADYQVNPLAAVLLMPKNASYQFEHTSGRAMIEYAFQLSAEIDGEASERLLRDTIERVYSACSNARIQNVFGGVQPATFQANAEMERLCSGRSGPVRARDLRGDVLERLVAEIESLPVVSKRIGGRSSSSSGSCLSRAHEISDPVERDEALSECMLAR